MNRPHLTTKKETPARSTQLSLEQYDSDKISGGYLERYDPVFEPWVDKPITLLELGVYKGGSLLLWHDYFPVGQIVGIDINPPREFKANDRIRFFEGSQTDIAFLSKVAGETAPDGFDIIIDDASHVGELTKISFWHLFEKNLKPGGLYVIEDWGTGYWGHWSDGKDFNPESYSRPQSQFWAKVRRRLHLKRPMRGHNYGMVGFIKQLIDEQGFRGRFEKIMIVPAIVFIYKKESPHA